MQAVFLSLTVPDADLVEREIELREIKVADDLWHVFHDAFMSVPRAYVFIKVDADYVAIVRMAGLAEDGRFRVTPITSGRSFPLAHCYDSGDAMLECDAACVAHALWGEVLLRGVLREAEADFANLVAEHILVE